MAYNNGREDRKWRIWKEAEEKVLREHGVDETTIEQIRIDDRADFNSNRRFYHWTSDFGEYLEGMADKEQSSEIKTVTVLQNFWKAHCFINSLRLGSTFSPPFSLESWWCFPLFAGQYCLLKKTPKIFGFFSKNFLSSKIRLSEKPGQTYRYCKRYSDD